MSEKKQRRKNSVTSFLFQEQPKSPRKFMQQSVHVQTKPSNEFISVSSFSGFSEKNRHKSKSFLKNKKNLRIKDETNKNTERTIDKFQNNKQDYYIKGMSSRDFQKNQVNLNEELFTLRNKNQQEDQNENKNQQSFESTQQNFIKTQLQKKQEEFDDLNQKFQKVIQENQQLENHVEKLQKKIEKQKKDQEQIMEFFKEMEEEKQVINESLKNIQEKEQQVAIHAETIVILKNNIEQLKQQLEQQVEKNLEFQKAFKDSQKQSTDFKQKIQELLQIQEQTNLEKRQLQQKFESLQKQSDSVQNCSNKNFDQVQQILARVLQFINIDQNDFDFQNFSNEEFENIAQKIQKKLKTIKFVDEEEQFKSDFLKYLKEFFQNLIKLLQLTDQDKNEFHFEQVVDDIERQYGLLDERLQKIFKERESFEIRVGNLLQLQNHIRTNIDKTLELSQNILEDQDISDKSFLNQLEEEEQHEHQKDFEIIQNRFYKLENVINELKKKQQNQKEEQSKQKYINDLKSEIQSFKKLTDSMEKELDDMENKLNEYKKTIYQLQQENQELKDTNTQNLSVFDRRSVDSRMRQSALTYKSNQSDKENIPIQNDDQQRVNFIQEDDNDSIEEDNDEEDLISQVRTSIGPNESLGDLPEMILNSDNQKDIKLLVIETFKIFLKKNQTWQIQCDKLREENQKLKSQINDKEIEFKKMKIEQLRIPHLEKQIHEFQSSFLQSQSKMKSTIDTNFNQSFIGKFKEILIEAIEAPLELQEENMVTYIDLAQKQFKMLKSKISSLQQVNENQKKNLDQNSNRVESLQKEIKDLHNEKSNLAFQVQKLQKQDKIDTSLDNITINQIKQENQELSKALIQMNKKFDMLLEEKNQLYKTFNSLKSNFSKMSFNYMKLENEYNLANEDNKRLEEHLQKVNDLLKSANNEESIQKVKNLNDENMSLQQSILMLSQKIDVSSLKCTELEEEIKIKDKENKLFLDERRSLLKKLQKFASLSALKTEECEEKTLRLSKAFINLAMVKSELQRVTKNNFKFNQFFSKLFINLQQPMAKITQIPKITLKKSFQNQQETNSQKTTKRTSKKTKTFPKINNNLKNLQKKEIQQLKKLFSDFNENISAEKMIEINQLIQEKIKEQKSLKREIKQLEKEIKENDIIIKQMDKKYTGSLFQVKNIKIEHNKKKTMSIRQLQYQKDLLVTDICNADMEIEKTLKNIDNYKKKISNLEQQFKKLPKEKILEFQRKIKKDKEMYNFVKNEFDFKQYFDTSHSSLDY